MYPLILATHNEGKKKEFHQLLKNLPFEVKTLRDLAFSQEIEETGESFEENARIKAEAVAEQFPDAYVLADDSGLCVDVLHGAPGIYSARYAGENSSYAEKFSCLWHELSPYPQDQWTASFVCLLYLYRPHAQPLIVEGRCPGHILPEARGEGGFGYDPIFFMEEVGSAAAEVPAEVKNRYSHRAKALQQLRVLLEKEAPL